MAQSFAQALSALREQPRRWVVTGAAGFIGSHLLETLLAHGQEVRGIDNFSTGSRGNLDDVKRSVGEEAFARFSLHEGDVADEDLCKKTFSGCDFILHQAALGSVPRSLKAPLATNHSNVDGHLAVLTSAKEAGVRRVVYASSSSVYGDHPGLPKKEPEVGQPLSPYAASKVCNEIYARVFSRLFEVECAGLRYFNVFGPRQNPRGAYAAVIPCWILARLSGEPCTIFGDGETSRDFSYVDNVVQANILAALAPAEAVKGREFNVALGGRTTLNELYAKIDRLCNPQSPALPPRHAEFRAGDVRHSLADISLAQKHLGYEPQVPIGEGLEKTVAWFREQIVPKS